MLPDLRELKRNLARRLSRRVQEEALRRSPLLAEIQSHHQIEGDRFSYETHEGDIQKSTFKALRTPVTTKVLPSPVEQQAEIVEKLDEAAQGVAKQGMELLFATVNESSQRAGTAFNAGGKPFHIEMLIDALDAMQVDFDEDGRPRLPTMVLHPDQLEKIRPKFAEWEKDSAIQARLKEVLSKKKVEWRDRESRRKLVG